MPNLRLDDSVCSIDIHRISFMRNSTILFPI